MRMPTMTKKNKKQKTEGQKIKSVLKGKKKKNSIFFPCKAFFGGGIQ